MLKPNEIIFLNILDGKPKNFNYSDKYKYEYGIFPEMEAEKLKKLGYVEYKYDIIHSLSCLKIPELKEILKNNDLETKGKKQDLIERILGNIDIDELEKNFGQKYYFITDKGKQVIQDNYLYILNDIEHYGFSEQEIQYAYSLPPQLSDSDRIWNILTMQKDQHYSKKQFYEIKYDYCRMANFLYKKDKFNIAINYFIAYFILNLSKNDDYSSIEYTNVDSSVINKIKNCISLLDIENSDELIFQNNLCDKFQCYYTKEQLCIILRDCLQGIDYDYRNYYTNASISHNSIENTTYQSNNMKQISLLKLSLAICTCGISILLIGIYKK